MFGAPLAKLLGFTGVEIFAYHQGLFFGLFFLSFCLIVARSDMRRRDWMIATASALVLGGLSNALFQAASYPHYEIAMIAIASLAIAAWLAHYRLLFVLCLAWLPLVREDGGFYAAIVCIACIALPKAEEDREDIHPAPDRAGARRARCQRVVFSDQGVAVPWLQRIRQQLFWRRVEPCAGGIRRRPRAGDAPQPEYSSVLLGSAVLAAFDIRYLTGLVLLSPILLLHLLAVRPEHGYFTLYFALPWLLPCAVWLAVFVRRSTMSRAAVAEGVVILAAALALSAPVQSAAGARGSFWFVASWAFQRPVEDIPSMQNFVRWARKSMAGTANGRSPDGHKGCVSFGISALIPDDIRPDEALTTRSDLRACDVLFLMRGDVQYGRARPPGQGRRIRTGKLERERRDVAGPISRLFRAFRVPPFTLLGR